MSCGRNLRDRKRRCARTTLCRRCYRDPAVRDKFRVGHAPPSKPAATPTAALPGSPAKLAVLARRLRWHQALYHAEDDALPIPDVSNPRVWARLLAEMSCDLIRGIYRQQKKTARWRAYPYDPRQKRRVHLGYFPTRFDAATEIVLWLAADRPPDWYRRRRAERWADHVERQLDTAIRTATENTD